MLFASRTCPTHLGCIGDPVLDGAIFGPCLGAPFHHPEGSSKCLNGWLPFPPEAPSISAAMLYSSQP